MTHPAIQIHPTRNHPDAQKAAQRRANELARQALMYHDSGLWEHAKDALRSLYAVNH